jgi:hypothetical protein
VAVTLRDNEEGWELQGIDIVLEAGRLDALSRDVMRFLEGLTPSGK